MPYCFTSSAGLITRLEETVNGERKWTKEIVMRYPFRIDICLGRAKFISVKSATSVTDKILTLVPGYSNSVYNLPQNSVGTKLRTDIEHNVPMPTLDGVCNIQTPSTLKAASTPSKSSTKKTRWTRRTGRSVCSNQHKECTNNMFYGGV
jgi:hypothetical protein